MTKDVQWGTDPFTAEIFRSYLTSTVREMVITTTRTAFSTCFCHGEDFTCALFDNEGRMIAQDQGVTVHTGAMEEVVRFLIAKFSPVTEGDVLVHNDPYNWGTHQADGLVCRPIFYKGELVGFSANRGHWTDIGGMAPGGWSGMAQDVVQEGLIIPGVRLVRAGQVDEEIRSLILRNVRMADQLWGDIQAQIASNIVAERRIHYLIERYGLDGFRSGCQYVREYSRRRFLFGLEQIPDGTSFAEDVLEDDGRGGGPFPIRVTVTKRPNGVRADFTGTHPQVMAPINCTLACTKAAVVAAFIAVVDPDIPLNGGLMECIEVVAPRGTMVNPVYPAPTFGATADPVARVCEVMLQALGELVPYRVPAGSYSTGNNVTGAGRMPDGGEFLWYSYQSGGCGARPGADGNSAEWHLMANSKNESMELWEVRYPIEFLGYGLIPDSGGAGRWRGGLGTERRLRMRTETRLTGFSDHHGIGAGGVNGGRPGLPNGFAVIRDGQEYDLATLFGLPSRSKFSNITLRAGDIFVSRQGGGGGYGDPHTRDESLIRRDLQEGYITREAAESEYGYRSQGGDD